MLTAIYNANLQVPKHCGIFVGTGGSGLLIKKSKVLIASDLLLKEESLKISPDIILNNCLMGKAKGCEEYRVYKKQEFQCGWRYPFV
ncbi:1733_t:CDS:2, partial [Cetraspora pellucida]